MPEIICKWQDRYFLYSKVVDAPLTVPMKLDDFKQYYLRRNGTQSFSDLENRIKKADEKGADSRSYDSLEKVFKGNRYGDNYETLSLEDAIAKLVASSEAEPSSSELVTLVVWAETENAGSFCRAEVETEYSLEQWLELSKERREEIKRKCYEELLGSVCKSGCYAKV